MTTEGIPSSNRPNAAAGNLPTGAASSEGPPAPAAQANVTPQTSGDKNAPIFSRNAANAVTASMSPQIQFLGSKTLNFDPTSLQNPNIFPGLVAMAQNHSEGDEVPDLGAQGQWEEATGVPFRVAYLASQTPGSLT